MIRSFLPDRKKIQSCSVDAVREGKGYFINSFQEIVERVAMLAFHNPEYVLFFRGQKNDIRDDNNKTTIFPRIFRAHLNKNYLDLTDYWNELENAEKELIRLYDLEGKKQIRRYQILRWAILQHYEVCDTPLLDVTHSLRVACSFAYMGKTDEPSYLYILGLPQISGSITASSEHGVQIISV